MAMVVASRYARALADVVGPTGKYRQVLAELESFAGAYHESAELREVFDTPAVPLAEKMKVLEAILERLEVSPIASNFLHVLAAHYRMGLLEEILQAFERIVNDRLGVVEVKVFSATPLSEAQQATLRAGFQTAMHKGALLEFQVEESLLGGILARVRSTVYDGSIRGRLARIRERLTAR
jgi:F-type H+-transporting ATPase subunit delta